MVYTWELLDVSDRFLNLYIMLYV